MQGIILAGGSGSRLFPTSQVVSKQLLPVYSSPLIYHSLSFLMRGGIKDFAVITNTENVDIFEKLFKDGSQWGIKIKVIAQEHPNGIAEAYILAEDYIAGKDSIMMLGDNMFYGYPHLKRALRNFKSNKELHEGKLTGAMLYGYRVADPSRYGVIDILACGCCVDSIEEKPKKPKSNTVAVGLYVCDGTASERAKNLKPSKRGELEITDLLTSYLKEHKLEACIFDRGVTWLDAGTVESLADASRFVEAIENRSGLMVACPEEVALKMNYIDGTQYDKLIAEMPTCSYKDYLTTSRYAILDTKE